jgi:hypothetical protein
MIYLQTIGGRDLVTKPTESTWKDLSLPYIAANTPIIVYKEFRSVCANKERRGTRTGEAERRAVLYSGDTCT